MNKAATAVAVRAENRLQPTKMTPVIRWDLGRMHFISLKEST